MRRVFGKAFRFENCAIASAVDLPKLCARNSAPRHDRTDSGGTNTGQKYLHSGFSCIKHLCRFALTLIGSKYELAQSGLSKIGLAYAEAHYKLKAKTAKLDPN